jgi:hypothetical protein
MEIIYNVHAVFSNYEALSYLSSLQRVMYTIYFVLNNQREFLFFLQSNSFYRVVSPNSTKVPYAWGKFFTLFLHVVGTEI